MKTPEPRTQKALKEDLRKKTGILKDAKAYLADKKNTANVPVQAIEALVKRLEVRIRSLALKII